MVTTKKHITPRIKIAQKPCILSSVPKALMYEYLEFPKIRGTFFWRPFNKVPTISGIMLGYPFFSETRILYGGHRSLPRHTWRFMGSYKWSYKSPNMSYNYSCLTYNPTYNCPTPLSLNPKPYRILKGTLNP